MYFKRVAETAIKQYANNFPAVGLTGPRQSGKSTLLKYLFPDYQYVNFDDIKLINYFDTDPEGFIKQYSSQVVFDEVQYVPDIFNYIKIAVDNDRHTYGNFILTGSSQFSYLKKASESLAGRIGLMSLLPLQYTETPKALRDDVIFRGSYPELILKDYRASELWYSSYLETYLNKDVRAISNIGDLRDFKRFIHLLAANTSQLLEQSQYAKQLSVSVPTIKRWLSILEASYIIFFLPPYYNNLGKRIIKSPKVYFYDTGLVSYLTGITTKEHYENGPMAGALFENYVISEIKKKHLHTAANIELFFLRTSDGTEIDLIVDSKQQADWIEIKKTSTFSTKLVSTLKRYCQKPNKAYLLYNGDRFTYGDIEAINFSDYLLA